MASDNTTKKNAPVASNPSVSHMTLHTGDRYFCAICHDKGKNREEGGTPAHLCHHCGRAFCSECAPTLGLVGHFFFQHQELKSMHGRGQRLLPGQRRLEPAHCDECVHYAPRMIPWSFLGLGFVSVLFVVLYAFTGGQYATELATSIGLLWVLWVVWGLIWHSADSWVRQKLYFPVDGGKPLLFLQEFMEANGVLDGEYQETFAEGSPYGELVATVPLRISMIEELNRFADTHRLSEDQLANIDAVAGSVVMEGVGGILKSEEVWPQEGARRWELAAPLPEWPLLWDMKEDQLEKKVPVPKYKIRWRFWLPFPVQVQAHFPLRSDRRTLELHLTLAGSGVKWKPFLLSLAMKRGDKLPGFKLLPVQGRSIQQESQDEIEVQNLEFENDRARVLLRFNEPVEEGNEALWLTGSAKLLVTSTTISGVKIKAFYNAFGNLVEKPRTKVLCWVDLNFKVNVAKVPYQRISEETRELVLEHTNAERDDAILKALGQETQLIQVDERVHRAQLLSYGANDLPPTREIVGRRPVDQDDDMLSVVYQMYLTPRETYTQVQIRVEGAVNTELLYETEAAEYAQRLEQIVRRADRDFWASSMSVGTFDARMPYPKQKTDLLSKMRKK
ncbi:MAG: FYVE zinc finger domain-containing protein [Ardenticatenaceae bacterium]